MQQYSRECFKSDSISLYEHIVHNVPHFMHSKCKHKVLIYLGIYGATFLHNFWVKSYIKLSTWKTSIFLIRNELRKFKKIQYRLVETLKIHRFALNTWESFAFLLWKLITEITGFWLLQNRLFRYRNWMVNIDFWYR